MTYVTDLDKTLLRSDLSVSSFTRDVWNTLVQNGVILTFATARSFSKAQSLLPDFKLNEACIALNGCLIATDGSPPITKEIDPKVIESLIIFGHVIGKA